MTNLVSTLSLFLTQGEPPSPFEKSWLRPSYCHHENQFVDWYSTGFMIYSCIFAFLEIVEYEDRAHSLFPMSCAAVIQS